MSFRQPEDLRVPQEAGRLDQSRTVVGEDSTGKSVVGGGVDELAGLLVLVVLVDVTLSRVKVETPEKISAYVSDPTLPLTPVLTVMTGPKISSTMVHDLGSLVRMTVG